jgi:hypothetical protein
MTPPAFRRRSTVLLLLVMACSGGGGTPTGPDSGINGGTDSGTSGGNDSGDQSAGTVIGTVGPSGGTLTSTSGQVRLEFPAAAVGSSVDITVDSAAGLPTSDDLVAGTSYTFGPEGTTFAEPVALTITYDPARVPAGRSQASLGLYKALSSSWQEVESVEVDSVAHTVTGWIGGFSSYGVQGGRIENVDGTWAVNETVVTDECEDDVGSTDSYTVAIAQDGATITVTVNGNDYSGTVDGSIVDWKGSYDDEQDGGTVEDHVHAVIDAGGDHFDGKSTWTFQSQDDDTTCGGSTSFTGDRK